MRLLWAALVAVFAFLGTAPAFALNLPGLLAASPRVETDNGHGSGTVIAPGLILTAYHVIDGAHKIRAVFANGEVYEATLRARIGDDIAVLAFIGPKHPVVARLACRSVLWGEPIRAIGNPANVEFGLIEGIVMSNRPDPIDGMIALNLPEVPGMSGGGVFDARGNLLGVSDAMGMLPFGKLYNSKGEAVSGFAVPLPTGIGLMIPATDFCADVRAEFNIATLG